MRKLIKLISLALALLCGTACSNESITPEQAFCPIEIGVVMDINGIDDNSYNQFVWQGVTNYASSAMLSTSCFKYFESTVKEDYIPYLQTFADSVDIVIGASPDMADEVVQVANEYGRITFVIVDTIVDAPNVVSLNYDEQLLSFIAGRYAAYQVNDPLVESIAYIGDSIKHAAIFEQGALLVNENIHIEYEIDELHSYDNVVAAYDSLGNATLENAVIVTSNIIDSTHTIKKNISDDIYNIIKDKARRKLKMGNYNSTNVTLLMNDIDIARECKTIVNAKDFGYAVIPSFMLHQEEVVEETTSENLDDNTNENNETIEE